MAERFLTAEEAEKLRGGNGGAPDTAGYGRLLAGLQDGQALRVTMGGNDARSTQEANFARAAQEMGVTVAFSEYREADNVPYLVVTRAPDALRPHLPGE